MTVAILVVVVALAAANGSNDVPKGVATLAGAGVTRYRTAIRLHDLRHTHATLLLKAGVPLKVVSERLGHATPAFTMTTYQHVLPGMQRDAADTFAALISPPPTES